jgi:hypothetical protein
MEYSSVGVIVVGLGLGLVYLEKWSARQMRVAQKSAAVDGDRLTGDFG